MATSVVASTTSLDQEKFLAAKLLQRSYLKLVANSLCEKVTQPDGTGTQSTFVRYKRMNVPLVTLTESVAPSASSITPEVVQGSLDQWGDLITISDIAVLTTKHPLMQVAMELLSDNAQRVIDRETQIVMLAGTNTQLGDGTATTRGGITATMTVSDTILHKARITMNRNGAPPRDGPSNMKENAQGGQAEGTLLGGTPYVIVVGPELSAEVQKMAASSNLWAAVHQYQDKKPIYNGEVGTYLGFRFVETNFIPAFALLGSTTTAITSGVRDATDMPVITDNSANGGSLLSNTVYGLKITRKDLTRGFEESISLIHTIQLANDANNAHTITFAFTGVTANFAYNLYFVDTAGVGNATDAKLHLVQANIAVGASVVVTALQATGAAPPASNKTDGTVPTVYIAYVVAAQALAWVGLQNLQTYVLGSGATKSDPLDQIRTLGYKFMAKALILDQTRILRLELPSVF